MTEERHPVWAPPKKSARDRFLRILIEVRRTVFAVCSVVILWALWEVLGPFSIDTVTLIMIGAVLFVVSIIWVPKLQTHFVRFPSPVERFAAENEARRTVATIAAGIAILVSFYTAQKQLGVQQQGQFTDRYTKAIGELAASDTNGNPRLSVRLGGIYALEQVMNSSEQHHFPIMEVLCLYIRQNSLQAMLKPKDGPRADVRVALTVLGRRNTDVEVARRGRLVWKVAKAFLLHRHFLNALTVEAVRPRLDLSGSDLSRVNLSNLVLAGADLSDAQLADCRVLLADLEGAAFNGANLSGCFIASRLTGATFIDANLQGAIVTGTVSKGALDGANIEFSYWLGSHFEDPKSVRAAKGWRNAFYPAGELAALGLPPDHNLKLLRYLRSYYPALVPDIKLLVGRLFGLLRKQTAAAEDFRKEIAKPLPPTE